jgi:hypothetical protein
MGEQDGTGQKGFRPKRSEAQSGRKPDALEYARDGPSNRRGVWGVGSRQLAGSWKRLEGGWKGSWQGGWKPQFPVGRRLEAHNHTAGRGLEALVGGLEMWS